MGLKTPEEKAAKKARKLAEAAAESGTADDAPESPAPKKAKKEKKDKSNDMSEADAKAAKKAAKKAAAAAEEAAEEPVAPKAAAAAPAAGFDGVKSVFCTNLAWSIDENSLKELFAEQGEVTSVKLIKDRDTDRFKGMAIAEFANAEQAQAAIAAHNETEVAGRNMYCRLDNPKPKTEGKKYEARPLKPKPAGGCKLYCGNLSYKIDEAAVHAFFAPTTISSIRWVTDRESGDFKGCGFIDAATTEEADAAMLKQGEDLLGRPIRLDWAEDRPKREY